MSQSPLCSKVWRRCAASPEICCCAQSRGSVLAKLCVVADFYPQLRKTVGFIWIKAQTIAERVCGHSRGCLPFTPVQEKPDYRGTKCRKVGSLTWEVSESGLFLGASLLCWHALTLQREPEPPHSKFPFRTGKLQQNGLSRAWKVIAQKGKISCIYMSLASQYCNFFCVR